MLKNFSELYNNEIKKQLLDDFKYSNVHQIPKIEKIVLNMGVGEAVLDSKVINNAVSDLTLISGQKPVVTKAKKSIATYKLREGMSIGCKVTLRKQRMFDFLERLVYTALPRVKDFKGLSSKSFDRNGNITFGIKEQIVFSEVNYDKIDTIRGLDVTIVTTAKTSLESKALLEKFNIPFYN